MPRATVSVEPKRYDLETLPEGFVVLKRMSYGEWLHRTEIAMTVLVEGDGSEEFKGEVNMANLAVTTYEFSNTISEHNLQDDHDQLLDFSTPAAINLLDPRVGEEISKYITELHEFNKGK